MAQPKGGNNLHQFNYMLEILQKLCIPSVREETLNIEK